MLICKMLSCGRGSTVHGNVMERAMEVERELYDIHLRAAHGKSIEQKKDRVSGALFLRSMSTCSCRFRQFRQHRLRAGSHAT